MKLIRYYFPQNGGGNSNKNQKEQKGKDDGKMGKGNNRDTNRHTPGRSTNNQ